MLSLNDEFPRYRNMDYLFLKSVMGARVLHRIVISYDIACQWMPGLRSRMGRFPEDMWLVLEDENIVGLVPKFHLAAHIQACRDKYSFNYHPGVGIIDGEGSERFWSGMNQIATATKELGPGGRHDLIDVYVDHSNWRKLMKLGILISFFSLRDPKVINP
jgi:hypothetical protein